jgi:hypothetical protein
VELRFRAGVTVTIGVLDERNAPIAGASVRATKRGTRPSLRDFTKIQTDVEGRITLPGLDPEGGYVLSVTPPRERADLQALTRDPWRPADGDVVLAQAFPVTGVVHDASGAPTRAFVHRRGPDGTYRPAVVAQADGKFVIAGLPKGPLTLAASRDATSPRGPEVTVEAGATGVVLTVESPPPR